MKKVSENKPFVPIQIKTMKLTIRGRDGSPLVIHNFTEKAKAEIRARQQKVPISKKEARNPQQEFLDARYVVDGLECAKIDSLKKSIITAATAFDDITKIGLRQALFISPVDKPGQFIPIENMDGTPAVGEIREDAVTIGMGTRGLVYRPGYNEWKLRVSIEYNPRIVSEEQLLALIDQAGWGVGIHEGRPERTSALGWGRFERVVD
jgi:hypothetical protein